MAKDKKKDSKKKQLGDDLLDTAAKSLKKFRRVTRQMTKLSTGQKLVGGVALLAAGLTYLAKKQAENDGPVSLGAGPDHTHALADAETRIAEPELPAETGLDTPKLRKHKKSK